jgi:hypothetical protein
MRGRISVLTISACCGLLAAVGGFADMSEAAQLGKVSVEIRATTYSSYSVGSARTRSFSLTCNPTGGTLPLATRVCRDIGLHPKAMLNPPRRTPGGKSSVCSGGPFMPEVSVTAIASGVTRSFRGSPGCTWPGDEAVGVYFDATQNDQKDLPRSEALLRCDEDTVLFAVPTPLASVVSCLHGLWTPRSEQLIRIAEKTAMLAGLQPSRLFPHEIGALGCAIPAGGPVGGKTLAGLCGVTMKNVWSKATVSFTEDWPIGATNKTARHIWHIVIQGERVTATSQSGPVPPQLWR